MSETPRAVERPRSRRRRGDDDGAAAVEFALVSLLLFTLLFGIMEFALLLRDNIAVSSAVRTGARIASAEAGAGPATCLTMPAPTSTPPCSPTTAPKLAQDAADAVQREGSAMPKANIDELWVYKSNLSGFPGVATTLAASACTSANSCVKFLWVAANSRFQYSSGGWSSASINACVGTSDAVGVLMKGTHKYLFGMFGTSQAMFDRAVMQVEPLPVDSCQANKSVGSGGHL